MLKLRLLQKWGRFGEGSIINFGEEKGRPLIKSGVAVIAGENEKEKRILIADTGGVMKIKLLKRWGEFGEGSIIKAGESKATSLIAMGIAERTEENLNKIEIIGKKKRPEIETAMAKPKAETAEVSPIEKPKRGRSRRKESD